jgi:tyrosine-protein phosphatase SIW14
MKTIVILISSILFVNIVYSQNNITRPDNWAKPVSSKYVENFYKINDEIYRSAQPNKKAFKELAGLGIKTILNLREHHSDKDSDGVANLIMKHVEMNASSINDEEVIEALKIIFNSPKPILIHCQHGSDRTGVICAMFRIVFQNWSKQEAIDELKNGGYGFHQMYKNIPIYIEKADIEAIKKAIAK